MFKFNCKTIGISMAVLAILLVMPADANAAFESLRSSGTTIFTGLRDIIYPASAVGIIAVCIGGLFGNINWKWLTAIVIGLIVISLCGGFISMFADADDVVPNLSIEDGS